MFHFRKYIPTLLNNCDHKRKKILPEFWGRCAEFACIWHAGAGFNGFVDIEVIGIDMIL